MNKRQRIHHVQPSEHARGSERKLAPSRLALANRAFEVLWPYYGKKDLFTLSLNAAVEVPAVLFTLGRSDIVRELNALYKPCCEDEARWIVHSTISKSGHLEKNEMTPTT